MKKLFSITLALLMTVSTYSIVSAADLPTLPSETQVETSVETITESTTQTTIETSVETTVQTTIETSTTIPVETIIVETTVNEPVFGYAIVDPNGVVVNVIVGTESVCGPNGDWGGFMPLDTPWPGYRLVKQTNATADGNVAGWTSGGGVNVTFDDSTGNFDVSYEGGESYTLVPELTAKDPARMDLSTGLISKSTSRTTSTSAQSTTESTIAEQTLTATNSNVETFVTTPMIENTEKQQSQNVTSETSEQVAETTTGNSTLVQQITVVTDQIVEFFSGIVEFFQNLFGLSN